MEFSFVIRGGAPTQAAITSILCSMRTLRDGGVSYVVGAVVRGDDEMGALVDKWLSPLGGLGGGGGIT